MNIFSEKLKTAYRARVYPNYWDFLALLLVLAVIMFFAWNAEQMTTPYRVGQEIPISLNASALPFYAARTVMRMLIALVFSFLFTFIFGTLAAKNARAEKLIIPMIDVLQSVPILGFLTIATTTFIAMFPGSWMGPECAAIFAIFTSQAWNMAFSFYQTVRSVPAELQEAARMFHLSTWQRFWRIEVPYSMPGLLWNTMMSMSGGWFFVVASEAITVSNQSILLPGIGSYIATAIKAADMHAIVYAVLAMFIVIIIYDQLLFRPLVAWSDKFKSEKQGAEKPESWVINLFRRTRLMRVLGPKLTRMNDAFINMKLFRSSPKRILIAESGSVIDRVYEYLWYVITFSIGALAIIFVTHYFMENISLQEVRHVFVLGLITTVRVFVLIFLCSLIWVPVGVWVGLKPRAAQIVQPIAQILAAFPANLFYPFIVMLIVSYHLNANIFLTPLMILGAQWYILFNVIAGASTIPKDLLQVTDNFGAVGWLRWRSLILPAIAPYYITGAITAAGGAWNASIVAEVASWGSTTITAKGLGAYISVYTRLGDFSRIGLGIGMMCVLVLIYNRLFWRPLYAYAINRFSLE